MTDERLTAIYNEANGITGKRLPITTARIFAAMRAAVLAERDACAKVCERIGGKMTDDCDVAQPGFWPDQVAHRCATEIMARSNV